MIPHPQIVIIYPYPCAEIAAFAHSHAISMSIVRLIFRLIGILFLQITLVPSYLLIWKLSGRMPLAIAKLWMRGMCRMLGVHVHVKGTASTARPTLFVSNHISYLDILVLASHMDAFFISKDDVENWPGIGKLANLRGTLYINREAVRQAGDLCKLLRSALLKNDLILFPEGTTSDGESILDFKTSLFCMAMDGHAQDIAVQGISIAYTRDIYNELIRGERNEEYAWYGDAELAPHLLQVLKAPGVHVDMRFHPTIEAGTHSHRKTLAAQTQAQISQGLSDAWAQAAGNKRLESKAGSSASGTASENRNP